MSEETYLDFQALDDSENSLLEFANKHGALGAPKRHFHSDQTAAQFGESVSDWRFAIHKLRRAFKVWEYFDTKDEKGLGRLLKSDEYLAGAYAFPAHLRMSQTSNSLIDAVLFGLVSQINKEIGSQERGAFPQGCFVAGCDSADKVTFSGAASYQLEWILRRGQAKAEPRIQPANLRAAIWLQFSQLLTGERKVRKCSVCGKFMDLSETARPASKRMHAHCSLAQRMRRYRSKISNGIPETEQNAENE